MMAGDIYHRYSIGNYSPSIRDRWWGIWFHFYMDTYIVEDIPRVEVTLCVCLLLEIYSLWLLLYFEMNHGNIHLASFPRKIVNLCHILCDMSLGKVFAYSNLSSFHQIILEYGIVFLWFIPREILSENEVLSFHFLRKKCLSVNLLWQIFYRIFYQDKKSRRRRSCERIWCEFLIKNTLWTFSSREIFTMKIFLKIFYQELIFLILFSYDNFHQSLVQYVCFRKW